MEKHLRSHLLAALKEHEHVVFVTLEADGRLRTSRVRSPTVDENGTLWFLADNDAAHVHHVERNPEICIYCGDTNNYKALSISGVGFVVTNVSIQKKIVSMHNSMDAVSQAAVNGLNNQVLIKVNVDYLEYWDGYRQVRYSKHDLAQADKIDTDVAEQRSYA